VVVNLTENPTVPRPSDFGLKYQHFPIDDMGIPLPRDAAGFCYQIVEVMREGRPVLFHCRAGKGRTGLMLASCLVIMGRTAEEALAEVRRANPYYVETTAQEKFVGHFAEYVSQEAVGTILP
jgi:atypical dual specificity phosphatase